ncbi:MAG TPA: UDP-N-acetylmuramoyl-L-alanyl-D-glutamate--2,6-diaminopimelate ligase [Candidatus Binataceae bacterium]|nr:UDP-N-acetylmuramoyl-L-alanyl-D-glutamate--2,6-diaminopimelate ligase [Candidatus Binataceae bacterium]
MKLAELLAAADGFTVHGGCELEIGGLSYDSRRVNAGDLFFSLARDAQQNRAHLQEALGRGARAVVVEKWRGNERPAATLIEAPRPRRLMAAVAERFYNAPSERLDLIGITGTSGKTTTTYLLAEIFEAAGERAGVIGSIGVSFGEQLRPSSLTTPESIDFNHWLAEMEHAGVKRVAAEISSIGLEEGRADRLNFRAGMFTNLGRDHLDYHGTIENYFKAKLRLFTELLPASKRPDPVAIVRGDDPWGQRALAAINGRKISFGLSSACDVYPLSCTAELDGIRAVVRAQNRKFELSSPLLGNINLLNILAAAALSLALEIKSEAVVEGVRRFRGARGRMEVVAAKPGVTVVVDYAHKPDALAGVLESLRALGPRRLICVFGCGGDRDRGKRPLMGEIAARLSDLPILTSDNPRSEDPLEIIAQVEAGIAERGLARIEERAVATHPGYIVEQDRRAAIAAALRLGVPGDIIVIAGKGHEDYQLVGDRKLKFDDRAVVKEILGLPEN